MSGRESHLTKLSILVNGKSIQHDNNDQNGTSISKEKSGDDIEMIMLSKQVREKEKRREV